MHLQVLFFCFDFLPFKFGSLFNQKLKVMKNLKQNLVMAILCLGVMSVSFIACDSTPEEDPNVITLDQLDDVIDDMNAMADSLIVEEDSTAVEPTDMEEGEEVVENEAE